MRGRRGRSHAYAVDQHADDAREGPRRRRTSPWCTSAARALPAPSRVAATAGYSASRSSVSVNDAAHLLSSALRFPPRARCDLRARSTRSRDAGLAVEEAALSSAVRSTTRSSSSPSTRDALEEVTPTARSDHRRDPPAGVVAAAPHPLASSEKSFRAFHPPRRLRRAVHLLVLQRYLYPSPRLPRLPRLGYLRPIDDLAPSLAIAVCVSSLHPQLPHIPPAHAAYLSPLRDRLAHYRRDSLARERHRTTVSICFLLVRCAPHCSVL